MGLPNSYVLGEEGSEPSWPACVMASTLYTKNAAVTCGCTGRASVGFDWGGDGAAP